MMKILVDGHVVAFTNPEEHELMQWAAAQMIVNALAVDRPDSDVRGETQGGAVILPEPRDGADQG